MDKSNQHTYCSENQFLIVERHFTGNKSNGEIVKQYLSEHLKKMSGLDEADNVQYNYCCEKAVVTSTKEDSK